MRDRTVEGALPVGGVPDDGMRKPLEMTADLMPSAREELGLDEAEAGRLEPARRNGRLAPCALDEDRARILRLRRTASFLQIRILGERERMAAVDGFLEPAAHDGRIALLHLARHHDAPEPRGRVRITRKDEHARRPAVEPVHGPDPTAELLTHALHGKDRVAVGDLGAVHEKLLELHHGTHHVIKIKDGKNGRNGLGLNGRFGFE